LKRKNVKIVETVKAVQIVEIVEIVETVDPDYSRIFLKFMNNRLRHNR